MCGVAIKRVVRVSSSVEASGFRLATETLTWTASGTAEACTRTGKSGKEGELEVGDREDEQSGACQTDRLG
jgi:hypothetical protein